MVAHDAHGSHDTGHGPENITFRIARQDKPGGQRYWETFAIPYQPGMNVISCLQAIAKNPTPVGESKASTPVVWDCNCLEEVCGACTMVVNGKVRQACTALIDDLGRDSGGDIVLEPMSKFPVVRDLFVDRKRMFHGLKKVHAWIPVDGYHEAGPGPAQSPHQQEESYPLSECMTCGCCMEVCPQYVKIEPRRGAGESDATYSERETRLHDEAFLGPAVISQAVLFNQHPTGEMTKDERIEALMGPGGITDCGNAQNCVKICPKEIPLTRSIAKAGRQTTIYSLSRWLLK
ncbi:MAG TPA: succinate dehydrogenase iron-sulfur subunit [Phycisphaerae bacterium]|nr:succinate dehydrogenase iron-sulfur subunit [Phycisphaerae bacterium]HRW54857.1 succinate dehydrogenase iron-sulfur subunit [Phycisphaerae bacterium]